MLCDLSSHMRFMQVSSTLAPDNYLDFLVILDLCKYRESIWTVASLYGRWHPYMDVASLFGR